MRKLHNVTHKSLHIVQTYEFPYARTLREAFVYRKGEAAYSKNYFLLRSYVLKTSRGDHPAGSLQISLENSSFHKPHVGPRVGSIDRSAARGFRILARPPFVVNRTFISVITRRSRDHHLHLQVCFPTLFESSFDGLLPWTVRFFYTAVVHEFAFNISLYVTVDDSHFEVSTL